MSSNALLMISFSPAWHGWTSRGSTSLGIDDILIVAPYNAQVFTLGDRLPNSRMSVQSINSKARKPPS